jgi:hypothetical protein
MDIEIAIGVDIDHRHAVADPRVIVQACLLRHILEPEAPLVDIEPALLLGSDEVDIGKPVAVHITRRHAAAVVGIDVVDKIEAVGLDDVVGEPDRRLFGRNEREQSARGTHRSRGLGIEEMYRDE